MGASNILSTAGPAASAVIDIAATFKALYGYEPAVIPQMPPSPPFIRDQGVPYSTVNDVSPASALGRSMTDPQILDMIKRPVFMPLTLIASGTAYNFPFCVIGLKNKKILKETPMVERGGTVIEEVGIGPWEISVKGFLIDPNNLFPDDQLQMLNTLYTSASSSNQNYSVLIKSVLTDIFLMPNPYVVITDLDIPEKPKVVGVRDFSFTALQDGILSLTVTSPAQNATVVAGTPLGQAANTA